MTAQVLIDANGAMWRLRTLVAMGHDTGRIARALGIDRYRVRRLIDGATKQITPGLHGQIHQLWCCWWDKVPPQRDKREKQAMTIARRIAKRQQWPTPLYLDEDELDLPRYRPYGTWRPATGLGIAADYPLGRLAA
jgi:hypothetical protein